MSDWLPTVFTRPLQEPMVSDGPLLREFVALFWINQDNPGQPFKLGPDQEWLLDHILERYPDDWHDQSKAGQLRYEQCLTSMGRQNGKSVLGAVLGLYGLLMHVSGPTVVGLAESVKQANIIYDRVKFIVDSTDLADHYTATGTRGIKAKTGTGVYSVYPAKADALQGIPVSLCLYDEVHLTPPEMWAAMQLGTSARVNGMVCGITTAGDHESELLKSLYELGHKAAGGDPDLERFGFFLWEAPEDADIDDPEAIKAANPAIAVGRKDLSKTLNMVRTMPEAQARQYVHNRFVKASGGWMPSHMWTAAAGQGIPEGHQGTFIAVDRTHDWKYSTLMTAVNIDGHIYLDHLVTDKDTDLNALEQRCLALKGPAVTFVVGWNNKQLAERLTKRGIKVEVLTSNGMNDAASTSFAQVARGNVTHDGSPVVTNQLPYVVRKNVGSGYKILPATASHIEAIYATVMAIYAAGTFKERGGLLF